MRKLGLIVSRGTMLMLLGIGLWGCPPDYPLDLVVKPQLLEFAPDVNQMTFTVAKVWTRRALSPFSVLPGAMWINVDPEGGVSNGPFNQVVVTVTIDRTQLAYGAGESAIIVSAPGVAAQKVTVRALRGPGPEFTADSVNPFAGQEITFTDGTYLPEEQGPVTAWQWSFGDGQSSTAQNPTHTYEQTGTYGVSLTITTPQGMFTKTKPGYIVVKASTTPKHAITIDGQFDDWADVPGYSDPAGDEHDTDHNEALDIPVLVDHPDVDLLEYRFTHDDENLYAYFRAAGTIYRTQTAAEGTPGRYYAIVTVDVDNKPETGYWLHEGGYYPTSNGYDMNMEVEWYDGTFNTGHYINHGATNEEELLQAFAEQSMGIVRILPGSYDYYTQWVMFADQSIVFVEDKGPVYQGIVTVAVSADGHEAEMKAPFLGFMKDPEGNPIMALGKVLNISFSLEASGELAPGQQWASDTGEPIVGYFVTP